MTTAFHGDPAVKAALLAAPPIVQPVPLAEQAGLPLPIAALLLALQDRVATLPDGRPFHAAAIGAIPVGADLSRMAPGVAVVLIEVPGAAEGTGAAGALLQQIRALHRCQRDGDTPDPAAWKAVRTAALSLPPGVDRHERVVRTLCEAACWPADRGRSTLPTMLHRWIELADIDDGSDWSNEDQDRTDAILNRLWEEHAAAREAGEAVRYPALFEAADPGLFRRYEAHLDHSNRRVAERPVEFATIMLRMLADAPVAS